MKKATFTGPSQPLKVIDAALPEVPAEGVLIKTTYSGVCHSDVHFRNDKLDLGNGVSLGLSQVLGEKYIGTTFGHEICGTIIEFGDKADQSDLKIGDNVLVYPWIGCQKCETCLAGSNNMCEFSNFGSADIGVNPDIDGGFATHVAVPQCRFVMKVPEKLPLPVACMLPCSGATAYSSLLRVTPHVENAVKIRGEANLLVIGAGGLGLWCVQLAKKALFKNMKVNIFVADISNVKIEGAIEMGAGEGFLWDKESTVEDMVMKTTKLGTMKMDAIIDFVGSSKTADVAIKCLHNSGIAVLIGLVGGSLQISLPLFILSGITLVGSKTSSVAELADLVKIVSELELEFPNLAHHPLEEVNHVLDELEAGKIKGRAILKLD